MSVHFLSCYLYTHVKVQRIRAWRIAFRVLPDRAAFAFTQYYPVWVRCPKYSWCNIYLNAPRLLWITGTASELQTTSHLVNSSSSYFPQFSIQIPPWSNSNSPSPKYPPPTNLPLFQIFETRLIKKNNILIQTTYVKTSVSWSSIWIYGIHLWYTNCWLEFSW